MQRIHQNLNIIFCIVQMRGNADGIAPQRNTDLSFFHNIVPCGINNAQVTSLQMELKKSVRMEEVKEKIKKHFAELFQVKYVENE